MNFECYIYVELLCLYVICMMDYYVHMLIYIVYILGMVLYRFVVGHIRGMQVWSGENADCPITSGGRICRCIDAPLTVAFSGHAYACKEEQVFVHSFIYLLMMMKEKEVRR